MANDPHAKPLTYANMQAEIDAIIAAIEAAPNISVFGKRWSRIAVTIFMMARADEEGVLPPGISQRPDINQSN